MTFVEILFCLLQSNGKECPSRFLFLLYLLKYGLIEEKLLETNFSSEGKVLSVGSWRKSIFKTLYNILKHSVSNLFYI